MAHIKIISLLCAAFYTGCGSPDVSPPLEVSEDVGSVSIDKAANLGIKKESIQKELTPQLKHDHDSNERAFVRIDAEPYMTPELSPRYAMLKIMCSSYNRGQLDLTMFDQTHPQPASNSQSVFVIQTDETFFNGKPGLLWLRNSSVYFDGEQIAAPPIYKTITKRVHLGEGRYETRSEHQMTHTPLMYLDQVVLPKLKSSKTMWVKYRNGVGPVFDLSKISHEIETLESQCTPKDSQP